MYSCSTKRLAIYVEIARVCTCLEAKSEIKLRSVLGPDASNSKEMTLLNRVVRYTERGLEYEADPMHVEIQY